MSSTEKLAAASGSRRWPICWCCLDRGPGSFDVEDATTLSWSSAAVSESECHWKHPARNSVLLFVFCGQRTCANAIHCEMQCMVTGVLRDQQYMFGAKSLLMVEKVLLMRKHLFRRPMQRSQRLIPSYSLTSVCWDKYLNEFRRYVENERRYVEKWNFLCLTFKHVCLLNLFTFLATCMLLTLTSCKRKLLGKILHWSVF